MRGASFLSGISFRLWLVIVALAVAIFAGMSALSLGLTHRFFIQELRGRILDMVTVGARTVDGPALERLLAHVGGELSAEQVASFEHSAEYAEISGELNALRDVEKNLILYAYVLAPTTDADKARFVVDADVLSLEQQGAPDADISHFNQSYDIADFPLMKQAFAGEPRVESNFTYDADYHVNSFSGYAPLYVPGDAKAVALLGIDVSDHDVGAYLASFRIILLALAFVVVAGATVVALMFARRLARPLSLLLLLFGRAADGDLSVRFAERSRNDEVSRAERGFNRLMDVMRDVIGDVLTSSHALDDRSRSVAETATDLAATSEEQSASVASTKRVIEGLVSTMKEVNASISSELSFLRATAATLEHLSAQTTLVIEQSESAQDTVRNNVAAAESGRAKIEQTVHDIAEMSGGMEAIGRQMREVRDHSENIDRIVTVIGEISDRTNILAINAAIEAARLGTEGLGFRVVAEEIKKIADATTGYAGEIQSMIESIKASIAQASAVTERGLGFFRKSRSLAEETGKDLDTIVGSVRGIDSLVAEIRVAAQGQRSEAEQVRAQAESMNRALERLGSVLKVQDQGAEEALQSMRELAAVAERNAHVATELSDLARLLGERSSELSRVVAQFKRV